MTAAEYLKPQPRVSHDTAPYWEALREHKLSLPKCNKCAKLAFPPRPFCPFCFEADQTWTEMSGKGTVHTFSVVYQNRSPGFADEVPYVVGYVTLDEGPQMMSNITGIDPTEVRIGQKVELYFDDVTPDLTLPKFKVVE
ncbi:MAG: Zn-ribbon domain-containing OB-fold protein [Dehalococcoidia bacterium]|jgi:hypothetical protein